MRAIINPTRPPTLAAPAAPSCIGAGAVRAELYIKFLALVTSGLGFL